MKIIIRDFRVEDTDKFVKIFKLNDQYGRPLIEGPKAMKRVSECEATEY